MEHPGVARAPVAEIVAHGESAAAEGLSPGEIWRVMRTGGIAFLALAVIGAGVGYAGGALARTRFASSATVYVTERGRNVLSQLLLKSYADTAGETRVLRGSAARPRALDRVTLTVSVPAGTDLVTLTAHGRSAADAHAGASAAAAAFRSYLAASSAGALRGVLVSGPAAAAATTPSRKRGALVGAFVGLLLGAGVAFMRGRAAP